jgi:hypothetical protein
MQWFVRGTSLYCPHWDALFSKVAPEFCELGVEAWWLSPFRKIRNKILPDLLRDIPPSVGVDTLPSAEFVHAAEADGEEFSFAGLTFLSSGTFDLRPDPLAGETCFWQDYEKFVVQLDGTVNLFEEFLTSLDFLRGIPDTDSFVSETGPKAAGKSLV